MKSLTLFNQPIRIGEDGMICLTDMWKASGKSESESPYHYLRNKQTKEFLAELEKNHESVVFTERGVHGGTYGGKFVAYDYAAWLNPGFKYAAYKVLDDYFTGELQHRNSLSAQLNMKCHEFDQKKDMASFCGQGLAAWRYTKPVLVAEINSLANQLQITIPGQKPRGKKSADVSERKQKQKRSSHHKSHSLQSGFDNGLYPTRDNLTDIPFNG